MAQRSTKMDDVKRPEKVAPAATSRPILVTNRPILTDPMVVATDGDEAPKSAEPITRTAKTIEPMTDTLEASTEKPAEDSAPKESAESDSKETVVPAAATAEPDPKETETPTPTEEAVPATTSKPESVPVVEDEDPKRDSEAEVAAEEAAATEAKNAREQELEQLIASGKFAVPINAVQRKRSRMVILLLCFLALLLAAALFDAALDAGIIKLSLNIPHTNFLSGS